MRRTASLIARATAVAAITAGTVVLSAAPAAAAPGSWAAIAVSVQTGNIGYSYEQPSASAASGAAVDECGAGDCSAVVRVTNGCAAVAQAPNLAWGWAYAASRAEAERAAVRATPGRGARVLTWTCTGAYRG